jgi:hypothetical protein
VCLKDVVSWLKRGQKVPFLREKRPFKKVTPKVGANIGAITGILRRVLLIQLESSTRSRLEPGAISWNQSGVTISPLDRVTVILIQYQIF